MAEVRRIMISLPDSLLEEVDGLARQESKDRSECFREAMIMYIDQRKKCRRREKMRSGYQEMAEINIHLAENCLSADNQALENYVSWSEGSMTSDDNTFENYVMSFGV